MVKDFRQYELELGRRFLVPLLEKNGVALDGKKVLDAGCGYGGVLAALAEKSRLSEAIGIDVDAEMIRAGSGDAPKGMRLEAGDFFAVKGRFDLILLRDVLEHIVDVEGALAHAASLLNPGGLVYASFAPFHSPFGGHQHNGSGLFAAVPWLQFLPESWFRALLRLRGNSYKTAQGLQADMDTVLRTRLSLGRFRRSVYKAGFKPRYLARYLVRPDYLLKFGLPAVPFPAIPLAEEIFCTGVEALLGAA